MMAKKDINHMVRNCSMSIKHLLNALAELEVANESQDIDKQITYLADIEERATLTRLALINEQQKQEAERILNDA